MKITKIEKQKKDETRYNVYIDGKFYTGISEDELFWFRLKEGEEIEPDVLNEAINEDKFKKALDKAGAYVSRGRKTEKQVRDYLVSKEYNENLVEKVISRLKEYRYINDEEYAQAYIEQYSDKGERLIISQLIQKGIDREIIEEALSQRDDNQEEKGALKAGRAYLKGRKFKDEREVRSKLYQALARRGFSYDIIIATVETLLQGDE